MTGGPAAIGPTDAVPRRVLVVGATGFIGRRVVTNLIRWDLPVLPHGRTVRSIARSFPGQDGVALDLATAPADAWRPVLRPVDAVVFAAGIMGQRGADTYRAIHVRAARRVFDACAEAQVERVVLISALGVERCQSDYWWTKRAAEDSLIALGRSGRIARWSIMRPSVVIGRGGSADRLFRGLAAWPVGLRLVDDWPALAPLHVDDLAAVVADWVADPASPSGVSAVEGPHAMTLGQVIETYRGRWGGRVRLHLPASLRVAREAARLATVAGAPPPVRPEPFALFLDRTPQPGAAEPSRRVRTRRSLAEAVAGETDADPIAARLFILGPLARLLLAVTWIVSGLLPVTGLAHPDGLTLFAEIGLHGSVAAVLLSLSCGLDVLIGIALVRNWRPVAVGFAQLALIAGYTAVLTVAAPVYWLHPFGPLLKNLPLIGLVLLVMAREGR